MSLVGSGLVPQSYTSEELEDLGVDVPVLNQINPATALFFSFHSPSSAPLGSAAALEELQRLGCSLATKPWVDNHWSLILWKLAGLAALDPERERNDDQKWWRWAEVMKQLRYRYERELESASRPPLRLITTQDAPASSPMVLCVSGITWSERTISDEGIEIPPHPELEVTDGWYRLRAQVDEPLARAARRGLIKVGRKIAMAGARLSSGRKEPTEILEAYNSVSLKISGNSCHLAPWYDKLGYHQGLFVATLSSLTADGGPIAVADLIVVKAYPVAFIEFIEDADGKKHREGPRNEKDETQVAERWRTRREIESSKLRANLEKEIAVWDGYAERLEQKAAPRFSPTEDDSPPDHVDDLYDELEIGSGVGALIARLNHNEAGWLARHIREKIIKDRESSGSEIERQVDSLCPPREVRNFRVVVVQDAQTSKRPALRKAQLTVWDVLSLSADEEGQGGTFSIGQHFLVSNLIPSQQSAWMDTEENSEIYLSTTRNTKWTKVNQSRISA